MKRNWKHLQPTSLRDALEACKEFARERRNKSVERIADDMGLADHWSLYKYLQSGRLPANLIRPYQLACGCDFITRWLVASEGRLMIAIPAGQPASPDDMQALQAVVNDAMGALLGFYAGRSDAASTLAVMSTALGDLAWHRDNVVKSRDPELALDFEAER